MYMLILFFFFLKKNDNQGSFPNTDDEDEHVFDILKDISKDSKTV